jgi:putative membrane protein
MVAAYAVLIALFHQFFPTLRISIPIAVPAILATIISLLCWHFAQTRLMTLVGSPGIWGAIVNESRSLNPAADYFFRYR